MEWKKFSDSNILGNKKIQNKVNYLENISYKKIQELIVILTIS